MEFQEFESLLSDFFSERVVVSKKTIARDHDLDCLSVSSLEVCGHVSLLGSIEDHLSSREHSGNLIDSSWPLYHSTVRKSWDMDWGNLRNRAERVDLVRGSYESVDSLDRRVDKALNHRDRRVENIFCRAGNRREHSVECFGKGCASWALKKSNEAVP